ncbi:TetR/AcrR family transcriptional regulator [Zhongshania sp.]|jgi:AcrR family transcriptional regulator|uniref:TetR/AcrR family transcriptional regulator n=1 Tax=Zhongshania sp. TaxID=1971902 RepID=UPI002A831BB2|nr:TetR/AcrR family transcriptional regulator [Zhongshania sp.]
MASKVLKRKPKQERSVVTHNIIVESAAQVLLQRDYISTTTNRIAERAGVSVGSIYQYFNNKNEIYDAVLDYYLSKIVDAIFCMELKNDLALVEIIELLVGKIYGEWPEGPDLLRKLRQAPGAHFHEKISELKSNVVSYFSGFLDDRNEIVDVEDLDISLNICMNSIEGIFLNASAEIPPSRLAKEISLICSRYLLPREL